MGLQFILGSSGAGKTHYIHNLMIEKSLIETSSPFLVIVPEQFTLQTQQDFIQLHPRKGIMNIEVLSFGRLAYRIYDDLALANKTLLKETGKSMVIRKIVEESKEKYTIAYSNIRKKGYVKELKGLLTELYQYNWQDDSFEKVKEEVTSTLLKEKIKDAGILLQEYKDYLNEKYITTENTMDLLIEGIFKNEWLKDADIFIDGFYGFTPIQVKVIGELLKKSKNVNIVLTLDSREQIDDLEDESQLFYESKKVFHQLLEITTKEHIEIAPIKWIEDEKPYRYKNNFEIAHLEKNIYRYPYEVFLHKPHGLMMCQASNMRKEIQYVADSIMKLVYEKGYRYKDIAVVSGDLIGYETIIKQMFSQYDIPYFMDKKKAILLHPLVELLTAAFDIINKNFDYANMFRYIKTGFLNIDQEAMDRIENYVLAYGIRGQKAWITTWERPFLGINKDSEYAKSIMDTINNVKDIIVIPLIKLKEAIHSKESTVETITKGVFQFMRSLDIENRINTLEANFEEEGQLLYQKEYAQIYRMVIEILDQTVEILGDQKMNTKTYSALFQAGLEECEMGLVPPGLDQVVVGDLERTRLKETKALFVIGFNEGKVPKTIDKPNIISDSERVQLKKLGIQLAPDNKENVFKEQFSIYMALSRVSEKLYLSYSKSDLQGKPMRPSLLFYSIKKMYPQMQIFDLDEIYMNRCIINKPKPTFYQMVDKLKSIESITDDTQLKQLYGWYYKKENWNDIIRYFEQALTDKNDELDLCPTAVEAIYGNELNNSVSRLEAFAKCPFSHFMDYGLRLQERLDYSIKMPDIGILFHKAIDKCSRKIEGRGLDWKGLKDEMRDALVEEAVSEVIDAESRGIFTSNSRNTYLVKRLTRVTKRALWAIANQIAKGEFRPIDYELGFDADKLEALTIDFSNNKTMKLNGRVDRVDGYEEDDALYLTVVDYKSGNQNFDLVALYYGLQLQLFVYLNSVTSLKKAEDDHKRVIPAGVFYFHIDDPIIKDVTDRNKKQIERMIMKQLKLKGLVLDQQHIIKKIDASIEKASDIIPVALTINGELTKNSSVASLEQFDLLKQFVSDKVKELGTSIVDGNLAVHPYKRKTETGCDFCKYLSICRFEKGIKGNEYRQLKELTKTEIWEKLQKN
ncbi:MAG: helicase-exonuclease AddAB subunit AddB [Firmicutes bacterium HGW-Firmicutes-1]|jgi:ATP-dependent helicase/nuclease subunit B|nr:MAG: helicase-exonuclease AddAB subunit AddB [Firmicutes bacterium HGW-Firmicutes-1]